MFCKKVNLNSLFMTANPHITSLKLGSVNNSETCSKLFIISLYTARDAQCVPVRLFLAFGFKIGVLI